MNTADVVQTENLTRIYSSGKIHVVALKDVNLALKEAKFTGVTRPSSSGKSTLMNLVGGFDSPS